LSALRRDTDATGRTRTNKEPNEPLRVKDQRVWKTRLVVARIEKCDE
jgi:hypothetical protein